ncbi:MAG: HlyD family efflux transporter periplasmic adaptor subunit, partial [Hyphomicrobium sp.]
KASRDWIERAAILAEQASAQNRRVIGKLPREATSGEVRDEEFLLLVPVPRANDDEQHGRVVACVIKAHDEAAIQVQQTRLELCLGLLSLNHLRRGLTQTEGNLARLKEIMGAVGAVGESSRFKTSTMSLCNELAARWRCDRVSVGFVRQNHVRLETISATDQFARNMQLVLDIEAAMDECFDQDIEIAFPDEESSFHVARDAERLSNRHGPCAVLSVPLRRDGEVVGVLTTERPRENPISLETAEAIRMTCDLCTTRLLDLKEQDCWVGAKFAGASRSAVAALVGPHHTWAKLLAILVSGGMALLTFGTTAYKPDAPFVLRATHQQVVTAPFDGHLESVLVHVGDEVQAGKTALASLDTAELELELSALAAERAAYRKQEAVATREGKTAEAQVADAQAAGVTARIELIEYWIKQATLTPSQAGVVVTGDLQRHVGTPVKTGDVLFEVAQLDSIWAEVSMPEDAISDIRVNMRGELATTSYPSERIPFVVTRIEPMAELSNQRNIFKIHTRLERKPTWMRPGMRGVAKIEVGPRSYGWIVTHRLADWLRMKLWL